MTHEDRPDAVASFRESLARAIQDRERELAFQRHLSTAAAQPRQEEVARHDADIERRRKERELASMLFQLMPEIATAASENSIAPDALITGEKWSTQLKEVQRRNWFGKLTTKMSQIEKVKDFPLWTIFGNCHAYQREERVEVDNESGGEFPGRVYNYFTATHYSGRTYGLHAAGQLYSYYEDSGVLHITPTLIPVCEESFPLGHVGLLRDGLANFIVNKQLESQLHL